MTKDSIISHKYLAHIIFEGSDINPNGDPDNAGAPRQDPESGHGRVSGTSMTRKIKDRVHSLHGTEPGYDLLIKRGITIEAGILASDSKLKKDVKEPKKIEEGDQKPKKGKKKEKSDKEKLEDRKAIARQVAADYYDARMSGAVLNVGSCKAESIKGTITMDWGRSVYPIQVLEDGITRANETNEDQKKNQEMGRRYCTAHGVYRQSFSVNPFHAAQNGATMWDLALYLDSLLNGFEFKHSGMSGTINVRGLWLFRHSSPYGDFPAYKILDSIKCTSDKGSEARSWDDYNLQFDRSELPDTLRILTIEDFYGGAEKILDRLLEE